MGKIIVNATAARTSGALSIIYQFIRRIPDTGDLYYIIFVDSSFVQIERENVKYIVKDTKCWIDRILWDAYGLNKWIKKNDVDVSVAISFQNTGFNLEGRVPQIVYYHNPFPISNYKWSFFKSDERILFLYRHFYSFFVSKYLFENSHIVVQLPFIKKAFQQKFKLPADRIHIIRPDIEFIDCQTNNNFTKLDSQFFHFIYPATEFLYKNHLILLKALNILKRENYAVYEKIKIHFTIDPESKLKQLVDKYNLSSAFVFEGLIPHEDLLLMYRDVKGLLFSSYLETFGLPLIEAAGVGLPILVSDLPYSHDVLERYEGANFITFDNEIDWKNAILRFCNVNQRYKPLCTSSKSEWISFFHLVYSLKK